MTGLTRRSPSNPLSPNGIRNTREGSERSMPRRNRIAEVDPRSWLPLEYRRALLGIRALREAADAGPFLRGVPGGHHGAGDVTRGSRGFFVCHLLAVCLADPATMPMFVMSLGW